TVNPNGPVTVTTRAAEFQLLPSGYVQGFLIKNGAKLTLDDPHTSTPHSPDYLLIEGKAIGFTPDFSQVRVVEPQGKLGRGKRIEIRAHAQDGTYQLQQTLVLEAYDDLPNVLLTSVQFQNMGSSDVKVDQVVLQSHTLNASLAGRKSAP